MSGLDGSTRNLFVQAAAIIIGLGAFVVMSLIDLETMSGWWKIFVLLNIGLQMLLFKIQSEITALSKLSAGATQSANPPKESFKMATSVITMGPIIILYPFLQKYFVKGMVVGAVKG